ncbi:mitotic control protein [Cryptosporidium ubiquitum]|uniref:Ribosomal RNA-processing protein 44 n=1 Tax=Cryptosporidium ubiquitum TaxID=857276 RepID=A0A1J4ME91_9CRYT|nr:mitotic control protein [Cryptosporidium ubiquitum]OII71779.1 mitotic control protein [Cryptosporidium ubiquitum]
MSANVENSIFNLSSLKSCNKSYIKKTRKGKIRKVSNEIYVRNEILCGVNFCDLCYGSYPDVCKSKTRNIIFPNFDILNNYDDFILEDESLSHVIIPYSMLEYLNETDRMFINKLRNKIKNLKELPILREELELFNENKSIDYYSNQYIRFPDTQFTETYIDESIVKFNLKDCAGNSIIKVATWFINHLSKCDTNIRFFILTESEEWIKKFNSHFSFVSKCLILSPYEYVNYVSNEYINSGDKLPFKKSLIEYGNQQENNYIFPEYATDKEISLGIDRGFLFKGILRMISRNRGEVEVLNKERKMTINIIGHLNLNRSIDGDFVVVKLDETLNCDEQNLKSHIKSKLELEQIEDLECNEVAGIGSILLGDDDYDENSALNIQNTKIKNTETENYSSITFSEDPNITGRIVGVLNRNWGEYCGSLIPISSSDDRFNVCNNTSTRQHRIFVPIDPKIPRIIIHTKLSSTLENQRLVVVIDEWECSSFYPTGHIVGILGKAGNLETETSVILRIRDINSSEFSPSVLKCLPNHGRGNDWKPNEIDLKDRVDLRHKLVFSVDPPGCKDIDDALSIELIKPESENSEENWYHVSVHIADVTHFVKPNTSIDDEASRRSTTCYLVNKRIDMLPEELTTNICSLVANKDRLSFTCNWEINENAEIRNVYFNKTIINSKFSFTYLQAQNIIDDSCNQSEVAISLRRLMKISQVLRKNRIARGAIELASSEVKVDYEESRNLYQDLNNIQDLDNEQISSVVLNVKSVSSYNYLNTNSMVEEFMLLANVSVAKQIISTFPNCCLLRRHPEPKYDQLEKLKNVLSKVGINNFVYENSLSLSNSLRNILDSEVVKENPIIGKLVRIMTTRTMNQAVYFTTCKSVEGTFHYGLAEELYTHFTSPIRRYADIVVHRLLSASIGLEPLNEIMFNKDYMFKLSNTLNKNKRNAQMAGRDSTKLFIYLFCKQNGNQETEGIIIQVRDDSLLIFVPKFGFEGLAAIDKSKYTFDADIPCLRNREKETDTLKLFSKVKVSIFASDEYFQNKVIINIIPDK